MREPGFHMSYWRFWLRFFDVPAMVKGLPLRAEWSSGGIVIDPAHTWFLYVLLVWSMVLLPVFLYLLSCRGAASGTGWPGSRADTGWWRWARLPSRSC